MGVMVQVEVNLKSEDIFDSFLAFMRENLPDTRSYEGCEGLTVQRNLDDPKNIVVVERWASREQYEAYLAWRGETGALGKLMEMTEGDPSIRFYSFLGC